MEKRQASNFYPHFNNSEKSTVDKLVGFFNSFIYNEDQVLTEFLDPAERDILKVIVGSEAYMQEFGGYSYSEKRRVILNKTWEYQEIEKYRIQPIEIEYPAKFEQLSHSSILGTLANSGVETSTFGDIITDGEGRWQFFVKSGLTDFFLEEIFRIGRSKVRLRKIPFCDVLIPQDDSIQTNVLVSSLRLDIILAAATRKSRSHIKNLVETGEAKLNWHEVNNSNIIVTDQSMLSLRHFGRMQVVQISRTRKGKYRVVLKLWRPKRKI